MSNREILRAAVAVLLQESGGVPFHNASPLPRPLGFEDADDEQFTAYKDHCDDLADQLSQVAELQRS